MRYNRHLKTIFKSKEPIFVEKGYFGRPEAEYELFSRKGIKRVKPYETQERTKIDVEKVLFEKNEKIIKKEIDKKKLLETGKDVNFNNGDVIDIQSLINSKLIVKVNSEDEYSNKLEIKELSSGVYKISDSIKTDDFGLEIKDNGFKFKSPVNGRFVERNQVGGFQVKRNKGLFPSLDMRINLNVNVKNNILYIDNNGSNLKIQKVAA